MRRDKFDATFSDVIRSAADWECEICHIKSEPESMSQVRMECSHDISRRFVITRYDSRNAICSCSACHRKTTDDPHIHHDMMIRIKGSEEVQLNRERAHSGDRLKPAEKDDIRKHWQNEMVRIKDLRMEGKQGKIELYIPEILL